MLKRTSATLNWVAWRSGDAVGRVAALLAEPALTGVWEVLECPYRAFAAHGGDAGLLMDDLSDHLLPDIDEPIAVADEDTLLSALPPRRRLPGLSAWEQPVPEDPKGPLRQR